MRPVLTLLGLAALAAFFMPAATAQTSTFYVDGANSACSDFGPGTEAQPWCSLVPVENAPAGSEVVVKTKGSSYGNLDILSSGLTVRGEGKPEIAGGGIRGNDVEVSGFYLFEPAPLYAQLDARGVTGFYVHDMEVERGGIRGRNCDGCRVEDSFFHDGASYADATADSAFCSCGIGFWGYSGDASANPEIRRVRFERWFGDAIHINSNDGSALVEDFYLNEATKTGSDHVDVIQLAKVKDAILRRIEFRNAQHGILVTDRAPIDSDGDRRALLAENILGHTRVGYAWNGPLGAGGLLINATFDGDQTRGTTISDSTGGDPTGSPGCQVVNVLSAGTVGSSCEEIAIIETGATDLGLAPTYELPAGHPAVDAGDAAFAPATDLRQRVRVGPPDIGALERQGEPPPPPPPAEYHPACEPICDEQIANLQAEVARLSDIINRASLVLAEK